MSLRPYMVLFGLVWFGLVYGLVYSIKAGAAGCHRIGEIDIRRERSPGAQFAGDDRTDRREQDIVGNRSRVAVRQARFVARHHVMVARLVTVVGMAVAAENRELVRDLSTEREMLADECPLHGCGDLSVRTADFRGRLGLEIPHVDRAGAPFQKQEDAGLSLGRDIAGRRGLELEQTRQTETAKQAGSADAQHLATCEVLEMVMHGFSPLIRFQTPDRRTGYVS